MIIIFVCKVISFGNLLTVLKDCLKINGKHLPTTSSSQLYWTRTDYRNFVCVICSPISVPTTLLVVNRWSLHWYHIVLALYWIFSLHVLLVFDLFFYSRHINNTNDDLILLGRYTLWEGPTGPITWPLPNGLVPAGLPTVYNHSTKSHYPYSSSPFSRGYIMSLNAINAISTDHMYYRIQT
jgi:hypothetical protein